MDPFYKRPGLLFAILSLLVSAVFLGGSSYYTDGHPTFPTDDSYIYFQYARQLASGHPFQYNTGDPTTTGMTSSLYWVILSLGYLIGFRGPLLFSLVFLIGFGGLLISAWLVHKIVVTVVGGGAGLAAAVLFLINGQIAWGYLSGLEIPVFTTLLLLSVLFFLRDLDGRTHKRTMVACALLSICRPEGIVLGCSLAVLLLVAGYLRNKKESSKSPQRGWVWILLPFSISVAYLVMNKAVGGHFSPASGSSKSLWVDPYVFNLIFAGTNYVLDTMRGIFGASYPSEAIIGSAGSSPVSYFAPLALFFFLFGSFAGAARELRSRQISGFTVLVVIFIIGVGFVAFTSASGFQHHRYLIPFYPFFVSCMVAGVFLFASALSEKLGERPMREGILAFFIILSVIGLTYSFAQYAFDARLVRESTVRPGAWIKHGLKEDDILGLVDAGALKYYGERKTVDLLGLTTARFYGIWRTVGWGGVAEEVSHMAEGDRPSHIALMSSFAQKTEGIESLYGLLGDKVYEPVPIFAEGQTVFRADYSAVDAGMSPISDNEGWTLVDSLDVGYSEDERRCEYSVLGREYGVRLDVGFHSATYDGETEVADAGRIVLAGERFTISTLPGKTLRMVARSTSVFKAFRHSPITRGYVTSKTRLFVPVDVYVDGVKLEGAGIKTLGDDRWHETMLEIPAGFVVSEKTTIEIIGSYNSFHYWFFQE